MHHLCSV